MVPRRRRSPAPPTPARRAALTLARRADVAAAVRSELMASGRAPDDLLDDLSSKLRPSTTPASYLTHHRQRIATVRVMRGTKVQD